MANRDSFHPAWMSHAGGSAALFEACGPDRFRGPFEKSLLYFHGPQFVGQPNDEIALDGVLICS